MDAAALAATWRKVVNSPYLRDLPFKLELNEDGKVEFTMSPATNRHSWWQFRIGVILERALGGEALVECSILTGKGVKVADVVWCSPAFLARHGYETPYTQAPELCVEVTSPSNTADERLRKCDCIWQRVRSKRGSSVRTGRWNYTVRGTAGAIGIWYPGGAARSVTIHR